MSKMQLRYPRYIFSGIFRRATGYPFMFLADLIFIFLLSAQNRPVQGTSSKFQVNNFNDLFTPYAADSDRIDTCLEYFSAFLKTDTVVSMQYIHRALDLCKITNDSKRLTLCYLKLCDYYRETGNLTEASFSLGEAGKYISFVQDKSTQGAFFLEQGRICILNGSFDKATKSLFNALHIYEELNDLGGVAKCNLYIGNIYFNLEKINDAMGYYKKALDRFIRLGNEEESAKATGNIGVIYRAKNQYDSSLLYIQRSLKINQKLGLVSEARIDLHNLGTVYYKLHNYSQAAFYFNREKDLSQRIGSNKGQIYAYLGLAVLDAEKGNFNVSNKKLNEALILARAENMKNEKKIVYDHLAGNYEKMGNYRQALKYEKEFEKWEDSTINEVHLHEIKKLEIMYQSTKKSQIISLLTKEKEIRKIRNRHQSSLNKLLTVGLSLICIVAGLLIYSQQQRSRNQRMLTQKNTEIRESNFRQQLIDLEIKALRAQLNPHFVFNCLSSINRMILSGDTESASRYLTLFSKLIRTVLENSEHNTVALSDELSLLEKYVRLESLRFGGKIRLETSVEAGIDPDDMVIPPMVLQPIVENAIWHGLMHRKGGGKVSISMKRERGMLKCSVFDDGVGREKAVQAGEKSPAKNTPFGIQLTRDRLALMHGENAERLIDIEDLKDAKNRAIGTCVNLFIPLS